MRSLPLGYSWDESLNLGDETAALTYLLWPNYLVQESDIPDSSLQIEMDEKEYHRRFLNFGIRRDHDQKLVAHLSAVLIPADLSQNQFPDKGWRFLMEAVASPSTVNCMCLVVANVDPTTAQLGLSQTLLEQSKETAKNLGFTSLLAPVRPTYKSQFQELKMSEYLLKRTELGEIFDPWLRTHHKHGGEILNICEESVLVKASLQKWREWIGIDFKETQSLEIPGGLAPLQVDFENNFAIYREPNVWVRYRL